VFELPIGFPREDAPELLRFMIVEHAYSVKGDSGAPPLRFPGYVGGGRPFLGKTLGRRTTKRIIIILSRGILTPPTSFGEFSFYGVTTVLPHTTIVATNASQRDTPPKPAPVCAHTPVQAFPTSDFSESAKFSSVFPLMVAKVILCPVCE